MILKTPRWLRTAPLILALACVLTTLEAPPTQAASGTVTIVGTSDVDDSGLVNNVLKPGFAKAYPGETLNYVSRGTGAAIAYAKAGTADGLIVHAASQENSFVGDGYSAEQYGRSVFWGDYVLLSHSGDPAHVLPTGAHDIVAAYRQIATAGAAGQAVFVSRADTSGTVTQERAIWALADPGRTYTCTYTGPGGGQVPSTTKDPSTGNCPSTVPYPAWYQPTGFTQGPNVTAANNCTFPGSPSSPANGHNCYVFTDRGTFNYLQSLTPDTADQLSIVTRDNADSAPGGRSELVNAFHAYAVNPQKVTVANAQGAKDFLDYLTSPQAQSAVGSYLNGSNDPPFIPSATPLVSITNPLPARSDGQTPVTVSGTITNRVPGYPPLDGVGLSLAATPAGSSARTVATATTDANGGFRFSFVPQEDATYSVAVPAIAKVENASLSPQFGDLLTATTQGVGTIGVDGSLQQTRVIRRHRRLVVGVHVTPAPARSGAVLQLFRARPHHRLRFAAQQPIPVGASEVTTTFRFPRGRWLYALHYVDPGATTAGTTVHRVRIR